jgi:hypothetical protein
MFEFWIYDHTATNNEQDGQTMLFDNFGNASSPIIFYPLHC